MKAIETVYKGYKFRSRLEARWAVFFDVLGVKWEYEKEGFDLDGLWYLPDFWLPELKYWIEIKGLYPTKLEQHKISQLALHSKHDAFILYGCDGCKKIAIRCYAFGGGRCCECYPGAKVGSSYHLMEAYTAARQARF